MSWRTITELNKSYFQLTMVFSRTLSLLVQSKYCAHILNYRRLSKMSHLLCFLTNLWWFRLMPNVPINTLHRHSRMFIILYNYIILSWKPNYTGQLSTTANICPVEDLKRLLWDRAVNEVKWESRSYQFD